MKTARMGMMGLVAVVCLFAQGAFAGWVVEMESTQDTGAFMKQEASKISGMVLIKIQDGKMRTDFVGMSAIMDLGNGDHVMLMHERKQYLEVSGAKVSAARAGMGVVAPAKAMPTGNKDTINGYEVEEYVANLPDRKLTCWMTKDGAQAQQVREMMGNVFEKMFSTPKGSIDYASVPGYPIRMVMDVPAHTIDDGNGKSMQLPNLKIVQTVKSIKEEKLDGEVFKKPADYKEMVVPARAENK